MINWTNMQEALRRIVAKCECNVKNKDRLVLKCHLPACRWLLIRLHIGHQHREPAVT